MMMAMIVVMVALGVLLVIGGLSPRESCDHQFVLFSSDDYGTHRAAVYECERCGARLTGQA